MLCSENPRTLRVQVPHDLMKKIISSVGTCYTEPKFPHCPRNASFSGDSPLHLPALHDI